MKIKIFIKKYLLLKHKRIVYLNYSFTLKTIKICRCCNRRCKKILIIEGENVKSKIAHDCIPLTRIQI